MNALLLDIKSWDLCLDLFGDIALASEPYAMAQDAASAIRTFQGEVYYDTKQGIPYFGQILGQRPPARDIWIAASLGAKAHADLRTRSKG